MKQLWEEQRMIENRFRRNHKRGMRKLCVFILLGLVLLTCVACGGGGDENFTPPPATIIRASDGVTPTMVEEKAPPTATALPLPTSPPQPTVASPTEGYPIPAYTPDLSITPMVYPTK
jgi:hypothetical protein